MEVKADRKLNRRAGRPTQQESSELTEVIIRHAWRSFIARGFAGTTVEKLAAELGITRRSIMQRYPSKDDLLFAVAARDTEIYSAALADLPIRQASVTEDLRTVCVKLWSRGSDPDAAALLRCILGEVGRLPRLATHINTFTRQLSVDVRGKIEKAQGFGYFKAYEASMIATCAVALVMSHPRVRTMLFDPRFAGEVNLDAYFDEAWNFIREMA
ncbi:MAG: TetR/AcrR family transcriptional regulator [Rhodobiaceae bacterium]|nr:TetR/AcrR family transcriptional regulator [Rhodobiaceae bacterium]MCC0055998.1 TetR/AcrR family transcriptional regulator [Rhodobiaceae bacterium]